MVDKALQMAMSNDYELKELGYQVMDKEVKMLFSEDPEICALGASILLKQRGPEWCLHNLPKKGYTGDPNEKNLKMKCSLDRYFFTSQGVGILLRAGYIQCRPVEHFRKSSLLMYKIYDFDEKEVQYGGESNSEVGAQGC